MLVIHILLLREKTPRIIECMAEGKQSMCRKVMPRTPPLPLCIFGCGCPVPMWGADPASSRGLSPGCQFCCDKVRLTQTCNAMGMFWLSGTDRGGSHWFQQFAPSPCSPGKFEKQLPAPLLLKLHHFQRQGLSVPAWLAAGNGLPQSLLTCIIPALGRANQFITMCKQQGYIPFSRPYYLPLSLNSLTL